MNKKWKIILRINGKVKVTSYRHTKKAAIETSHRLFELYFQNPGNNPAKSVQVSILLNRPKAD